MDESDTYQQPVIIPFDFTFTQTLLDPARPVVYFVSPNAKKIYALNYETKALQSLDFVLKPGRMKMYQGELFVTLSPSPDLNENGSIAIVDSDTFTLKDTLPVDTNPYDIVIDHDGYLYVVPYTDPYKIISYDRHTKQKISVFAQATMPGYAEIDPVKNRIISAGNNIFSMEVSQGKLLHYYPDSAVNHPLDYLFFISPDGKYVFNASGLVLNNRLQPVTNIAEYMFSSGITFDLDHDRFFAKHTNVVTAYDYRQGTADQDNLFPVTGTFTTLGNICYLYYQSGMLISVSALDNAYSPGGQYFLEVYPVPDDGLPNTDPMAFPGNEVPIPVLIPQSPRLKSLPLDFEPLDSLLDPNRPVLYLTGKNTKSVYALNYDTNRMAEIPFQNQPEKLAFYNDTLYVTLTTGHVTYTTQPLHGEIGIIDADNFSNKDKMAIETDPYDLAVDRDGNLIILPGSNQWQSILSYSGLTKTKLPSSTTIYAKSIGEINPITNTLYTLSNDRSHASTYNSFVINNGMFSQNVRPFAGDDDNIVNTNFRFSPDGQYLFNGSGMVYNLNQGPATKINSFRDIAFDLENSRFFTGKNDGTVTIYEYNNQNLGNVFHELGSFKNNSDITALQYRDNRLLIVGNNVVKIFTIDPGTIPLTADDIRDETGYTGDNQSGPFGVNGFYPLSDTNNNVVNTPIVLQMNRLISAGANYDQIILREVRYGKEAPISKKINGHNLEILPDGDLFYNTPYILQIPAGALHSSDQESYDHPVTIRFETGSEYSRYGGGDRIETSLRISQAGWDTAQVVVLATSEDYPDALTAAPLAGKYHAPILLTPSEYLPNTVGDEIKRLKPRKIVLIGGEKAISAQIEESIRSLNMSGRIDTVRIFGEDRYATSHEIAQELESPDSIIVATGTNFPDALSVAAYATEQEIPILLSKPDGLKADLQAYVEKLEANNSYIIGGASVLSRQLEQQLPNPKRIAGKDRYDTNFQVLSTLYEDYTNIYFATGENYPDALSGSVLAARENAPMVLLSGNEDQIPPEWRDIRSEIKMKHIFGGEGVIPTKTMQRLFE